MKKTPLLKLKIKKSERVVVKNSVVKIVTPKDWSKTYVELRKKNLQENPIPEGMSQREYTKLHKLPEPWRVKGTTPYTSMSLFWWGKIDREKQKEFRKKYRGSDLCDVFKLNKL
jgi:hypothetical protein